MAHPFQKRLPDFGPFAPLAFFIPTGLLILSASRLGLAVWLSTRITESGIGWTTFFLQGIRADLIQVSLFSVPLLVMTACLANRRTWALFRWVSYFWVLLALTILIFLEASTPSFILQYDQRPNRLFVEYLKYPREVLSTLWHGFRVPFLLGIFGTLAFVSLLARAFRPWLRSRPDWTCRKQLVTLPIVGVLLFGGIRSTTDHRAANPALFALTNDPLVNGLVINSTWSVVHAIYNLKHEAKSSEVYGRLSPEEILRETNLWRGEDQLTSPSPLSRYHEAVIKRDRPLNLVIVLEESMGAGFVDSLGGSGMTPELDRLAREGWWFENLYATGTRSVRGIESVISGFLPTPARSVVKLSLSQTGFFTLADLLGREGYHTEFIYGGESHFDNMRLFFAGNGFEEFTDQNDFSDPIFRGTWGVSDEDLFQKADEILQRRHQSGQPFFSLIFTSSNHSPFEYPDGRINPEGGNPATVDNAVKYADFALGKFIETAKSRRYWENTLFLIVADHDTRAYGNELVPIKNFHIPGLILGADLAPRTIIRVASQIDLPVTLLSLMGISANHPMIGRDHAGESNEEEGRAFMQFSDNYCMMEGEELVILQPHKEPVFGRYDRPTKSLELSDHGDPLRARRALAYALLPAWLYRNRNYQ